MLTFLKVVSTGDQIGKWSLLTHSAGFATVSLLFLVFWLITPTYERLAPQALLIAPTGLLWAGSRLTVTSAFGWALMAAGSWLAFMAKPTSATAFGLGTGLYLFIARKISINFLLVPAGKASP